MCDFCEERCCFFPLRWTSFAIGVMELLLFACVTVVSYFTLPDSDLGRSHNMVQYGLQAIAFVCGLFLLLGSLTENHRLVLVHVLGNGIVAITVPLVWLNVIKHHKHRSETLDRCLDHLTVILVMVYTLFTLAWFTTYLYYRQLRKDLVAPVLAGTMRSGQTSWNYLTRMSRKAKEKSKEKDREILSENSENKTNTM